MQTNMNEQFYKTQLDIPSKRVSVSSNSPPKFKKGFSKYIIEKDPLRITKTAGRNGSMAMYLATAVGIFCVIIGTVLAVVPGSSVEDVNKSTILKANRLWEYYNKDSTFSSNNIKFEITKLDKQKFTSASSSVSQKHSKISQKKIALDAVLKKNILAGASLAKQGGAFSSNEVQQSIYNTHFSTIIDLSEISQKYDYCLSIETDQTLEGMPQCNSMNEGIRLSFNSKQTLTYQEMINMNLCKDSSSCEKICSEHQEQTSDIQSDESTNSHPTLEKHISQFIESQNTCTASFSPKQICLVVKQDPKTGKITNYVGGCFKNNLFLLDFSENVKQTEVVVREQYDPYLESLNLSLTYNPIILRQTKKERLAKSYYLYGAFILFTLIATLVVIRVKQRRNQKFSEVSHVSSISAKSSMGTTELSSVKTISQ